MFKKTDEVLGTLVVHSYENNTLSEVKYKGGGTRISIHLGTNDSAVYSIAANKTYYLQPDVQLKEYVIQIIGQEKYDGFNCTKLALATHSDDNFNQIVWITSEIPDYQNYTSSVISNIHHNKLNAALEKLGQKGLVVKIQFNGNESSYQYKLQHVERRLFDESIFRLEGFQQQIPQSRKELKKNKAISKEVNEAMKRAEKEVHKMKQNESVSNFTFIFATKKNDFIS